MLKCTSLEKHVAVIAFQNKTLCIDASFLHHIQRALWVCFLNIVLPPRTKVYFGLKINKKHYSKHACGKICYFLL